MTRPQHILALVTSVAALTAFAPAASAARDDGRSRVASTKPAAAQMKWNKPARRQATVAASAKFRATVAATARFRPMLPVAKVRPGVG